MSSRQKARARLRQARAIIGSVERACEGQEAAWSAGREAARQDKALGGARMKNGKIYQPIQENGFRKALPSGKKVFTLGLSRMWDADYAEGYRVGKQQPPRETRHQEPVQTVVLGDFAISGIIENRGPVEAHIERNQKSVDRSASTMAQEWGEEHPTFTRAQWLAEVALAQLQEQEYQSMMALIRHRVEARGSKYSGGSK